MINTTEEISGSKGTTNTASNEEKYRRIIELSPVPMAIHVMGTVVLANQAAATMIGAAAPEELLGKNVLEYVHPDSQAAVKERIALLLKGERQHTELLEEKLIRIDGKVIHVEIISHIIEYNGKPSIQIILKDITEQKDTQKMLVTAKEDAEAERRRLHQLFMDAPAMIALVKGPSHIFELANPLYLKVTGKTPAIIGNTVTEVFPELRHQGIIELLDSIYKTGEPYMGNEVLIKLDTHNNGTLEDVYFNFVYTPSHDSLGNVNGIMVHAVDVTFQVQARQKIEEREHQYRSIFDATHDAILIYNSDGELIEANPASLKMYGHTHTEILRLKGTNLIHPDDIANFHKIIRSATTKNTYRSTAKHLRKDGTTLIVEMSATVITYKGEPHVMTMVRDITDQRQSQEELNYTNLLLQTVTDNASLGLFMMDDQQHCTFMNIAAEKIIGYSFAEVQKMNKPLHDIIHHTHPDGSHYPMADCPIDRALPQKNRQVGEDIFVRPDGTFYPVRFTASPIIKAKKPVGTIIEIEDLTELLKSQDAYTKVSKRSEELEAIAAVLREQREQLLALSQSKDEFISLASHQLRTPATAVKQYVAMAIDGYAGDISPQLRRILESAYASNERQLTIVNDLLKVAQIDAGKVALKKEEFNGIDLIAAILQDDASKFAERDQNVSYVHPQEPIKLIADKNRLRMVIENIIDNASKYTPSGKSIKVAIRQSKSSVRISIKDDGVGMTAADVDKIFQKFVRIENPLSTKVGGTGLGLYWAERIIALHGGKIIVKSELGKGSTFTICLPA